MIGSHFTDRFTFLIVSIAAIVYGAIRLFLGCRLTMRSVSE